MEEACAFCQKMCVSRSNITLIAVCCNKGIRTASINSVAVVPSMKCIRALFSVCLSCFVKSQLELVRVARETSRDRPRWHPSRRGLAQTKRLRAGYRYYCSWSYWAGIYMGYLSWFVKGIRHAKKKMYQVPGIKLLVVKHQTLSQ